MTRFEEIGQEASRIVRDDIDRAGVFVYAAQWADRTMIEKACAWLADRVQVDMPAVDYNDGQPEAESFFAHAKARYLAANKFVEQFRKAMEE